ncbi:flagellar hook assembly protein FlgD [Roseateles sp.]|jgi:flagellar basal-body rod modification protein FlgD|uniref:flagellar hook assembly protein FlgD n=1 Tax=Roseateles sp. TaxID=1971397 RepID=UPI0039195093
MDVTSLNQTLSGGKSPAVSKNAVETQDRFLKLLVAQMRNQDPMNPLDNAQVTSQMAQIQTVSGIATLDKSIQSLSSQFGQMLPLQGAALLGRQVSVPGNKLSTSEATARGAYELSSPADRVKLEVLTPAGTVLDTVELGAQGSGLQRFEWNTEKGKAYPELAFRITATKGSSTLSSSTYAVDKVASIGASATGTLQLQLARLGVIDYGSVKSID